MPRLKNTEITPAVPKRVRRSEEQRIRDLEARLNQLKARAAAKSVKRDPTLAHVSKAIRSIDKAASETTDATLRGALRDARSTLAACVHLQSATPMNGRRPSSSGGPDPKAVLAYVEAHPGQRSEQISKALGTDAEALRRSMKHLISEDKVRTQGERRATQYWPAG